MTPAATCLTPESLRCSKGAAAGLTRRDLHSDRAPGPQNTFLHLLLGLKTYNKIKSARLKEMKISPFKIKLVFSSFQCISSVVSTANQLNLRSDLHIWLGKDCTLDPLRNTSL